MKKVILFLVLLGCVKISAQTYTENFTKSYEPKITLKISEFEDAIKDSRKVSRGINPSDHSHTTQVSSGTAVSPNILQNITYTDGLGRPTQSIAQAQSPQGYDMVSFMKYDPYGREAVTYLPYPTTQNTGERVANPLDAQQNYYSATYEDTYAKSETVFDGSPLNRVVETSSPGSDWQIIANSDKDHTQKINYGTNATSEDIYRFSIDGSGNTPTVQVEYYDSGELLKNVVKNENWQPSDGLLNTVETYTNKNGRTIARVVFEKRKFSEEIEKRITQNVYDRQGRLRYILPPKAVEKVDVQQTSYTIDENLVYQYQYDEYNRQIAQRVPGKGWEYTVYDQLDRPILTQDANLAAKGQWLFAKYDALGRMIYSGIYASSKSREQLQAELDSYVNSNADNRANVEQRTSGTTTVGGMALNYTNNAFPVNGISEVFSVQYYDDYTFTDDDKPATPTTVQEQKVTTRTYGLQTAHFTKTLGQSSWNKLYTYYDEKGREIKIHHKNHLGGYTVTESQLDFRGKTELTLTKHRRTSNATELTIQDRFTYDLNESPLGHFQKINNQAEERIAENQYDALGMLIKKKVGGSATSSGALQEVDYEYNIRGQLRKINDVNTLGSDLFAYKINYNSPAEGASTTPAQYNGNISQTIWKSAYDNTKKSYAYQYYDGFSRLKSGYYQFNDNLNGNNDNNSPYLCFNTQYFYDEHGQGNLTSLLRNGVDPPIDQIFYNYGTAGGNQLRSVSDFSESPEGFGDGSTSEEEYFYDANGNMIRDLNKGITNITYNHLDLVETVSLPNNRSVTFQYDAGGMKLQKQYKNGANTLSTVAYLGGFQYTNGELQFFPTPEGYVYQDGNTYKYMYLYSDHVGNTRLSYTDRNGNGVIERAEIASNTDYYPFGMVHSGQYVDGLAAGYKYSFQGKEFQDESGLNWHDFGSRMYDPALGRWMATDPQNQFASPYLALGNNPITMVDPDGESVVTTAVLYAAAGGGTINLGMNWLQGNLHSVRQGLGYAAVGAASGVATVAFGVYEAYTQLAIGAVQGVMNDLLTQAGKGDGISLGSALLSTFVGSVSGGASRYVSRFTVVHIAPYLSRTMGVEKSRGMLFYGVTRAIGGAVGGFSTGLIISGGSFSTAINKAKTSAVSGVTHGLLTGIATAYSWERLRYRRGRPGYARGQVERVFENARQPNGNVYDPNTGELINWNGGLRRGIWDMGHKRGMKYEFTKNDYYNRCISKSELLERHRTDFHYAPERPSSNRGHKHE